MEEKYFFEKIDFIKRTDPVGGSFVVIQVVDNLLHLIFL